VPECLNDEMLLACYAKHNTSKMFPSCPLVSLEKVNNLKRRKSLKYAFVILGDVVDSNKCNTNKPQQKNWSKKKPHPCCTKALHAEQTDYDHQRYNCHHICQKRGLRQFSQQSHPAHIYSTAQEPNSLHRNSRHNQLGKQCLLSFKELDASFIPLTADRTA